MLDISTLLNAFPGYIAQGAIWGIMALGLYISYRLLEFSDLTVDGSFATGAAVTVMLIIMGWPAWAAMIVAVLAGMLAGRVVWGIVNVVMHNYTFGMIMAEGFGNAFPGIVLQMFLVPLIIYGLKKIHKIK